MAQVAGGPALTDDGATTIDDGGPPPTNDPPDAKSETKYESVMDTKRLAKRLKVEARDIQALYKPTPGTPEHLLQLDAHNRRERRDELLAELKSKWADLVARDVPTKSGFRRHRRTVVNRQLRRFAWAVSGLTIKEARKRFPNLHRTVWRYLKAKRRAPAAIGNGKGGQAGSKTAKVGKLSDDECTALTSEDGHYHRPRKTKSRTDKEGERNKDLTNNKGGGEVEGAEDEDEDPMVRSFAEQYGTPHDEDMADWVKAQCSGSAFVARALRKPEPKAPAPKAPAPKAPAPKSSAPKSWFYQYPSPVEAQAPVPAPVPAVKRRRAQKPPLATTPVRKSKLLTRKQRVAAHAQKGEDAKNRREALQTHYNDVRKKRDKRREKQEEKNRVYIEKCTRWWAAKNAAKEEARQAARPAAPVTVEDTLAKMKIVVNNLAKDRDMADKARKAVERRREARAKAAEKNDAASFLQRVAPASKAAKKDEAAAFLQRCAPAPEPAAEKAEKAENEAVVSFVGRFVHSVCEKAAHVAARDLKRAADQQEAKQGDANRAVRRSKQHEKESIVAKLCRDAIRCGKKAVADALREAKKVAFDDLETFSQLVLPSIRECAAGVLGIPVEELDEQVATLFPQDKPLGAKPASSWTMPLKVKGFDASKPPIDIPNASFFETVGKLLDQVAAITNAPRDQVKLQHKGRSLPESETLKDACISSGSELQLTSGSSGGAGGGPTASASGNAPASAPPPLPMPAPVVLPPCPPEELVNQQVRNQQRVENNDPPLVCSAVAYAGPHPDAPNTWNGHYVRDLLKATPSTPELWKAKVQYQTEQQGKLYVQANVVNTAFAKSMESTKGSFLPWQLDAPSGLMVGFTTAMRKMTELAEQEPHRCVACCTECRNGQGCKCEPDDRRLWAWHGNMTQRDAWPEGHEHDAAAAQGMMRPWKLLYFLCAMGSGKTMPETTMPISIDWFKMQELREQAGMQAEPCTLLTAPGTAQITQMRRQGLGQTDLEKIKKSPMCKLTGIDPNVLLSFNQGVVYLDEHTCKEWFEAKNYKRLLEAKVFVGTLAMIAHLMRHERDLEENEYNRLFHERKIALWLSDEAHFGLKYPANNFVEPDKDLEWQWPLHTFKYAYVAKFSGSIHKAEHEDDRVPKGGRCTCGELITRKRMQSPRITVCSYEGMQKYDNEFFSSSSLTDADVHALRNHPRYTNVFFWEVMRELLKRRQETGLPLTAMIRLPLSAGGVERFCEMFKEFLVRLGDQAVCPLTGRRLTAAGTWSSKLSKGEQSKAQESIRWAVMADVLFVYNQCVLGYDNQSVAVSGNAQATSKDHDAGQTANQFMFRPGRWASVEHANLLGLKVAALHHVGCAMCKEKHIAACERASKKDAYSYEVDYNDEPGEFLCGRCEQIVPQRKAQYHQALKDFNEEQQTFSIFMQQIDCEHDSYNYVHLKEYLEDENALNLTTTTDPIQMAQRMAQVRDLVDACITHVTGHRLNDAQEDPDQPEPEPEEEDQEEEEGLEEHDEEEEEEEQDQEEEAEQDQDLEQAGDDVAMEDAPVLEDGEEEQEGGEEEDGDNDGEGEGEDEDDDDDDGGGGEGGGLPERDLRHIADDNLTSDEEGDDADYQDTGGSGFVPSHRPSRTPTPSTRQQQKLEQEEEERSERAASDAGGGDAGGADAGLNALHIQDPTPASSGTAALVNADLVNAAQAIDQGLGEQEAALDEALQQKEEELDEQEQEEERDLEELEAVAKAAAAKAKKVKEDRERNLKENREKRRLEKEAAARRAALDKKRAQEVADAQKAALNELSQFEGTSMQVALVQVVDDLKLRCTMQRGPCVGCQIGLAWSPTGAWATREGNADAKTSYKLVQLLTGTVTAPQLRQRPYVVDFDRPANIQGSAHFKVFALKPGGNLDDPDPKRCLRVKDLLYATAPQEVNMRVLEANTVSAEAAGSAPPSPQGILLAAAGSSSAAGSSTSTALVVAGANPEPEPEPEIDYNKMAISRLWKPNTGRSGRNNQAEVSVKRSHHTNDAFAFLMQSMTPGSPIECYNAVYACLLLDLTNTGIQYGKHASPASFPRHYSHGWSQNKLGEGYVDLLAKYLQWWENDLTLTEQHRIETTVKKFENNYTVAKAGAPPSTAAAAPAPAPAAGGRQLRVQATGGQLEPCAVLEQYPEGWQMAKEFAERIIAAGTPKASIVAGQKRRPAGAANVDDDDDDDASVGAMATASKDVVDVDASGRLQMRCAYKSVKPTQAQIQQHLAGLPAPAAPANGSDAGNSNPGPSDGGGGGGAQTVGEADDAARLKHMQTKMDRALHKPTPDHLTVISDDAKTSMKNRLITRKKLTHYAGIIAQLFNNSYITKVSELPTCDAQYGARDNRGIPHHIAKAKNDGTTAVTPVNNSFGSALKWGCMALNIDQTHNWNLKQWVLEQMSSEIRAAEERTKTCIHALRRRKDAAEAGMGESLSADEEATLAQLEEYEKNPPPPPPPESLESQPIVMGSKKRAREGGIVLTGPEDRNARMAAKKAKADQAEQVQPAQPPLTKRQGKQRAVNQ